MKLFKLNQKLIFLGYLLLFLFFSFQIAYSQKYADIDIYLTNDGRISVMGDSNLESLQNITNSYEYTYKNKQYWILNFSSKEKLDDFIFRLHMPKGVEINYIKTTPNFRIVNSNDELLIIGTGSSKPLSILIQYKLNLLPTIEENDKFPIILFSIFSFILLLSILLIFFYFIKFRKDRNNLNLNNKNPSNNKKDENNSEENEESKDSRKKVFVSIFPPRQQDIIKILKEKEKITQKELEEIMLIPKSSISRNVKSLEVRKLIIKERIGTSNYLFLNEEINFIFDEKK